MGIFGGIKSTFKKTEAAVVVQNLLEHQVKTGLFDLNPAKLANRLIEMAWEAKPDVFNGKFGQRPHKITVAAAALANGIELSDEGDSNRNALVLSLGSLLSELEVNGQLYPLNSLDHKVLEYPLSVFEAVAEEFSETPDEREFDEPASSTEDFSWEEWYQEFKEEAGRENSQLEINDDGSCLIDFMEHEPLKRAYRDGIDPKALARDFAAQFDVSAFGR